MNIYDLKTILQQYFPTLQQMQFKTFSKGHSSYQLSKLNWTPLPFQNKKPTNTPSRRYLHSAVLHQDSLYILGGVDNETELKDNKMYCLDLITMRWSIVEGKPYTEGRNSHAAVTFQNEIYFFGGSQYHLAPTNDFFKYSPTYGVWQHFESDESVPCERQLAILSNINDEYMILIGGIDMQQDKIYEDAYLFKYGKWNKLDVSGMPSKRIKMGIAVCGRKLYFFGGQGPGEFCPTVFNDLYEIHLNQFDFQLTFKEILPSYGSIPQKRTSQGMCAISDIFFLVYGGQGRLLQQNGVVDEAYILGDLWIFDIEQRKWTQIQTLYGCMTPRYQFTMSLYKNEIYIFGGMNEEHTALDGLAKLQFDEDTKISEELCKTCLNEEKGGRGFNEPIISLGFYHSLAMEIGLPFKAIEMIADSAEELEAESIRIHTLKNIEDFDYLTFEFQGKKILPDEYFLNPIEYGEDSHIIYNMKLGALRLGKTMLYIQSNEQQHRVLLISADSRYSPTPQSSFTFYSYIERNGQITYGNGYGYKQAIYNILRSQVDDPYTLLSRSKGNLLVVFQLSILTTAEKGYYYELIFYSQPESDIRLYSNEKKMELLENMGYNLMSLPDFSCKSYFKYSQLSRKVKVYFGAEENLLQTDFYLQHLQRQRELGHIEEIEIRLQSKYVENSFIYRCDPEIIIEGNQGIFIYCGNQLIDRYDCKFGEIISDKFYKKKYKKRQLLFSFAGVIFLSKQLKLNITKTRVINRSKYSQILQDLIAKLKSSRRVKDSNPELQSNNILRFGVQKEAQKKIKKDVLINE